MNDQHMKVSLREASADDRALVHQIHDDAYYDVILRQFGEWNQTLEDHFFEGIWSHPGIMIVEYEGEPCGFFCVDSADDQLFIYEMVLGPEAQGKGIGTFLLNQTQDRATRERKKVKLEVLRSNDRARVLYERFGFKLVGHNDTHDQMEWSPESLS